MQNTTKEEAMPKTVEFDIKISDMDLSFVFEADGISDDGSELVGDVSHDDRNIYTATQKEADAYLKSLNITL